MINWYRFKKECFFQLKRNFLSGASNKVLQRTLFGRNTRDDMEFLETTKYEDVIPQEFPSRQCLQDAFVSRIIDLLPFFGDGCH